MGFTEGFWYLFGMAIDLFLGLYGLILSRLLSLGLLGVAFLGGFYYN